LTWRAGVERRLRRRSTGAGTTPRFCIVRQKSHYEFPIRREAEALTKAGYSVEVICMRHRGGKRREVVNGVNITALPASLGRSSKARYVVDYAWFFVLAFMTLTLRHLRRPYAVVQVNTMPDFLVFAAAVPKALGCRVVAYMHEPSPELAETRFGAGVISRSLALIEQRVIRFSDHAITVTDELKKRFVERGAAPERITVVLNGADPETLLAGWSPRTRPKTQAGFTGICHGTIEDRYGQETIIQAARLLRSELRDLRIVIVGAGSGVEAMTKQIEEAVLQEVVRYEGWVSQKRLNDVLHAADFGIVAQKASPYSHLVHTNKMVDYWIFGLPVIASRLRALAELYDECTLEYFEPGNAVDLARAIRRLYHDSERLAELARNGKLAQQRNGWVTQRRAYLGVYESLLENTVVPPLNVANQRELADVPPR
jgi:glycosyltransferase involved in cell wall biosynthesis